MARLRKATEADWDFLVDLRRATMGAHMDAAGGEYDADAQAARIRDRYDCARIVIDDGADIGLLKVDQRADPWHLVQIQLLPQYQRRGIGAGLIRQVLAEAAAAGVGVELGVFKANPARRLYERLGFAVVGESERGYKMLWTGEKSGL